MEQQGESTSTVERIQILQEDIQKLRQVFSRFNFFSSLDREFIKSSIL